MNEFTSRRLPPTPPRNAVVAQGPDFEEEDLFADNLTAEEMESAGYEEEDEGGLWGGAPDDFSNFPDDADEPFNDKADDSDDMEGAGMKAITSPRLPPQPPRAAAQRQVAANDEVGPCMDAAPEDLSQFSEDDDEPFRFDQSELDDGGLEDSTGSDASIYPLAKVHQATRPMHATAVVTLMQSIALFGVVSPVLVDSGHRIVAGAHRWAACTMLRSSSDERAQVWWEISGQVMAETELRSAMAQPYLPDLYLPYTVVDFDAEEHPMYAFELEAAENQNRKKYTRDEIRGLVHRLIAAGYTSSRGRPMQGAKPLGKCLEIFGISDATYRRALQVDNDKSAKSGISSSGLRKKIDALHRCFERLDEPLRVKASVLLDELKVVAEELDASPA